MHDKLMLSLALGEFRFRVRMNSITGGISAIDITVGVCACCQFVLRSQGVARFPMFRHCRLASRSLRRATSAGRVPARATTPSSVQPAVSISTSVVISSTSVSLAAFPRDLKKPQFLRILDSPSLSPAQAYRVPCARVLHADDQVYPAPRQLGLPCSLAVAQLAQRHAPRPSRVALFTRL